MDEKDLQVIRLCCRAVAAEALIEAVATVFGKSTEAGMQKAARQLLLAIENPQTGTPDLTLPLLDAAKSDLVAGEYQEAYQALVARLRPLLQPQLPAAPEPAPPSP